MGTAAPYKDSTNLPLWFNFLMTRETILGMLRQGNTGNEILSILDIIDNGGADDATPQSSAAQPTSEWIDFW